MEEIWPQPTVAELRRQINTAEKQITKIQNECAHLEIKRDEQADYEGDRGWECLLCGKVGYSWRDLPYRTI